MKRGDKNKLILVIAVIVLVLAVLAVWKFAFTGKVVEGEENRKAADGNYSRLIEKGAACFGYNEIFDEEENDSLVLTNKIISADKDALCEEDKNVFESNLKNLVARRKVLLLEDIQNNPVKALAVSKLPDSILNELSELEKEELIEKRGKFQGMASVIQIDDFENPENSKLEFSIKTDGEDYKLFPTYELPAVISRTVVSVEGLALDNSLAADSSKFNILSVPEYARENIGNQETLVILLNVDNNPAPTTVENARTVVFNDSFGSVRDFYIKNSYNKTFIVGDVLGPYNMSDAEICSPGHGVVNMALNISKDDVASLGKSFNNYSRLILAMAYSSCIRVNRGTLGMIQIQLPNGNYTNMSVSWDLSFNWALVSHELGHNFGASHANLYSCLNSSTMNVPFSYDCISMEYRDRFSIMGRGMHLNAPEKKELGWLTKENIIITTNGTYNLRPIEITLENETQALQIPIETDTSYYFNDEKSFFVEFRQLIDYDSQLRHIHNGIEIRIAAIGESDILYHNPTNLFDFGFFNISTNLYQLLVGESFVDRINGYNITLLNISGAGENAVARVKIERIEKEEIDFNKPLMYYKFDELIIEEGWQGYALAEDYAGYASRGEVYGNFSNLSGAIWFQGNGDYSTQQGYIKSSTLPNYFISKNDLFTISAWINFKQSPSVEGFVSRLNWQYIIRIKDDKSILFQWLCRNESARVYNIVVDCISNDSINLNKWHYIAGVYNKSNIVLYIDGEKKCSADLLDSCSLINSTLHLFTAGKVNRIGGLEYGYGINALVDEFKIYAKALNQSEIDEEIANFTPADVFNCQNLFTKINQSFNKACSQEGYDAVADINKDRIVNFQDAAIYSPNSENETWCLLRIRNNTSPCLSLLSGTIQLRKGNNSDELNVSMRNIETGEIKNMIVNSNYNGSFKISGIEQGNYSVWVKPKYFLAVKKDVEVNGNNVSVDFGRAGYGDFRQGSTGSSYNVVDYYDVAVFSAAYNQNCSGPYYYWYIDGNNDCRVNYVDYGSFSYYYGSEGAEI